MVDGQMTLSVAGWGERTNNQKNIAFQSIWTSRKTLEPNNDVKKIANFTTEISSLFSKEITRLG